MRFYRKSWSFYLAIKSFGAYLCYIPSPFPEMYLESKRGVMNIKFHSTVLVISTSLFNPSRMSVLLCVLTVLIKLHDFIMLRVPGASLDIC